ncbi:MAG: hypothetical protein QOJ19_3586 [Acidimicrobiia bacterium]|nr:hypothetical protein [Acidimicrobiia bacterium]
MSDPVGSRAEPDSLQLFGAVLLGEHSLDELLDLVVVLARRTVAGADGVSVTLSREGTMLTSNFSDDVVRELDSVQYKARHGPCVDATRTQRMVRISLDGDGSYPEFSRAAQQRFMTAVMSAPLTTPQQGLGALNFYSASVERFADDQAEMASLYAGQASILLANAIAYANSTNLNAALREALTTRELIGEAKGILMAREGCSRDEAFDLLRIMSQHSNRKLRTIAEELVESVQRHD